MSENKRIIAQYNKLAEDILYQYVKEIQKVMAKNGVRPSFDELLERAKALNKELTDTAIRLIEDNKDQKYVSKDRLTNGMKKIITESIEVYIDQL